MSNTPPKDWKEELARTQYRWTRACIERSMDITKGEDLDKLAKEQEELVESLLVEAREQQKRETVEEITTLLHLEPILTEKEIEEYQGCCDCRSDGRYAVSLDFYKIQNFKSLLPPSPDQK